VTKVTICKVKEFLYGMDLICEDLERHIVTFCDVDTVGSLYNVSASWRRATQEARLHFSGPINGSTFSASTYSNHGPVYMPFVSEIYLMEQWNPDTLRAAIGALDLTRGHRKRMIDLHMNHDFLDSCPEDVLNYLTAIPWNTVHSDCAVVDSFRAQNMNVGIQTLVKSSNFQVVNEITTVYFGTCPTFSVLASQKVFLTGAKSIVMYGVLTDDAMSKLPVNYNLERLCLVSESNCDWIHAKDLQRACPNLKAFSILSSNLIDRDLDNFDWSLWPSLKSLNVEHNYTFRGVKVNWPKGLQELYVAYTEIRVPDSLPTCTTIQQLSCNLYLTNNWYAYIRSKQLRAISVYMRQVITLEQEYLFWSSLNGINKISVHHFDSFSDRRNVRRACPSALVIKRSPVNIRQV
jgi:hypothetical protein